MAEEVVTGPSMFSATSVMKTPPTRVGRISKDITLPRTVELKKLVAGGFGAFIGLGVGLVVAGANLRGILLGALIFGALGIAIVTYSPLKGESLSTWIGLTIKARRNQVVVAPGVIGKAYIGIAPIPTIAKDNKIKIVAGAIEVSTGSFDERGVLVDRREAGTSKNLKNFSPPSRPVIRGRDRLNSLSWRARLEPGTPSFDLLPRSNPN